MSAPTRAIYAGSFDPITLGHLNVVERGSVLFDELIVAVASNTSKRGLFTPDERVAMIQEAVSDLPNVRVDQFEGLLIHYAIQSGATALIRGLRSVKDFEYEFQMALTNKHLGDNIDTVFLATEGKYAHIASSLIREIAIMGGPVTGMVPAQVERALATKLNTVEK